MQNGPLTNVLKRVARKLVDRLPPAIAVRVMFLHHSGRLPDLRNPRTFNEKVQYRKLHGDHALFASLADKVLVKDHVRRIVGDNLVIPTLWAGTQLPPVEERNWPLPFVIKSNRGSKWNLFVRTEADKRWKEIEEACARWLQAKWYPSRAEPWYDQIPPQVLVEPMLPGIVNEYRLYVFSGRARLVQIDADLFGHHTRTFYDTEWNRCKFTRGYHPVKKEEIERPPHLREMIEIAETLGKDFDFVRVDLYDTDEGPRFGELTFAPGAGYGRFFPMEYDLLLGEMWRQSG